jgi:hypothetical protein
MLDWLVKNLLPTAATLIVTLTVTFLFNKLVALPKELRKQRQEAEAQQAAREAEKEAALRAEFDGIRSALEIERDTARDVEAQLRQELISKEARILSLETAVNALPGYRAQSLEIQQQLQSTDREILIALTDIKSGILENQNILNTRLDRLEDREKNAIRAKLLDEYRLFTDEHKNPMLAWSEMEHHAFFKLVKDYEDLNGNDYVHKEVIPAMNKLQVIRMDDKAELLKLMSSRKL